MMLMMVVTIKCYCDNSNTDNDEQQIMMGTPI